MRLLSARSPRAWVFGKITTLGVARLRWMRTIWLPLRSTSGRGSVANPTTWAHSLAWAGSTCWLHSMRRLMPPSATASACLPKEVDCLRGSAGVATAKGNPAIAKRQLNKAVALAPYDARVQSSLALLELAAGEVDDAVARYRGLIDREPERAEYRLGIAEALIRSRDFAAALEQIEAGLAVILVPSEPVRCCSRHRDARW